MGIQLVRNLLQAGFPPVPDADCQECGGRGIVVSVGYVWQTNWAMIRLCKGCLLRGVALIEEAEKEVADALLCDR